MWSLESQHRVSSWWFSTAFAPSLTLRVNDRGCFYRGDEATEADEAIEAVVALERQRVPAPGGDGHDVAQPGRHGRLVFFVVIPDYHRAVTLEDRRV